MLMLVLNTSASASWWPHRAPPSSCSFLSICPPGILSQPLFFILNLFCNRSCSESCSFGWTYNHPFFFPFKKTDQNALLKDQHIRQASVWASSLPWKKTFKNKFDNQMLTIRILGGGRVGGRENNWPTDWDKIGAWRLPVLPGADQKCATLWDTP